MASSNKTEHMKLNSWVGTDHPTRSDFVYDNSIIDSTVGTHTKNSGIHLTTEEKQRVSSPVQILQHAGTGAETVKVSFQFSPKLVIVQKKNSASVDHETAGNIINGGVVTQLYGGTKGLTLSGAELTLSYSAAMSDGSRANFNESGGQYVIIAFR